MTTDGRDILRLWIEGTGVVVSAIVAWIVWKYTLETQRIREQGADELKLLRHQINLGALPILLPHLKRRNADAVEAELRRLQTLAPKEIETRVGVVRSRKDNFVCDLQVSSDAIAYEARAFIYDASLKNYLPSDHAMTLVSRSSVAGSYFTFTGDYRSHEQVVEGLQKRFGQLSPESTALLKPGSESFLAMLFLDSADRLHLIRATFVLGEDNVVRYRKVTRKADVASAPSAGG